MEHPEDRANHILDRLEHVEKAMPSETFLVSMERMALAYTQKGMKMGRSSLMGIAASLLLLIFANGYIVLNQENNGDQEEVVSTDSDYNLVPTKSLY